MQRVPRILFILLTLALFASACGGSDTPTVTDGVTAAESPSDTNEDAPEDLAMREPLDVLDNPADSADEDAMEDDADAMSDDAMSDDAMSDDAMSDDAMSEEDGSAEDDDRPNGLELNAGVTDEAIQTASEEAATCVTSALDASPELRAAWDDILGNGDTMPDDSDAVMDPILDCVTFGSVVAEVIEREDGVTLSRSTVGCIDNAVVGRADLLVSLIGDGASGDIDEDLLLAMVRCVSDEELTALMG